MATRPTALAVVAAQQPACACVAAPAFRADALSCHARAVCATIRLAVHLVACAAPPARPAHAFAIRTAIAVGTAALGTSALRAVQSVPARCTLTRVVEACSMPRTVIGASRHVARRPTPEQVADASAVPARAMSAAVAGTDPQATPLARIPWHALAVLGCYAPAERTGSRADRGPAITAVPALLAKTCKLATPESHRTVARAGSRQKLTL